MLKTSKKVSMMLLLGSLSTGLVHATIGMDVAGTNVVQQESVCKVLLQLSGILPPLYIIWH